MKVALAGQESLAKQSFGALERAAFHEALVVSDQHILDVIRVIEKENVLRAEPEINYVAVLARCPLQIGQSIAAKGCEVAAEQLAFRTWGITERCQPVTPSALRIAECGLKNNSTLLNLQSEIRCSAINLPSLAPAYNRMIVMEDEVVVLLDARG